MLERSDDMSVPICLQPYYIRCIVHGHLMSPCY